MAHGHVADVTGPGANWGAKTKEWLKFKPLKSRSEKAAAYVAATIVLLLVMVLYGIRLFGITPLAGRSMEPTFSALPVWPHLAAYYRVHKTQAFEIGSLIELVSPRGEVVVKRITKFSEDQRRVWVKGDNGGVTTMDSEDYGWVQVKNVRGVVHPWTPKRAWRQRTPEGRFANWIDEHEPGWALKLKTSDYLIYEIDGTIDIVKKGECRRLARLRGQFVEFDGRSLLYRSAGSLRSFDPSTGNEKSTPTDLSRVRSGEKVELVVRNDGPSFFGPTYVLVEKSLPKEAKLRINGKNYSLRSYHELDYDPVFRTPVAVFNLTPRDDSVPSGTVTAKVVSGEP